MATRVSYRALAANRSYLKWLPDVKPAADLGITVTDLADAELYARDRINLWIIQVAGPKRGAEIVEEFLDDTNPIDPVFTHAADLVASARISQTWEQRNFDNSGPDAQTGRKSHETLLQEAMGLLRDLRTVGYSVRSDGSVRRLRLSGLRQGPVVAGPMSGEDSLFEDDRLFRSPWDGTMRVLPHIHPLDKLS